MPVNWLIEINQSDVVEHRPIPIGVKFVGQRRSRLSTSRTVTHVVILPAFSTTRFIRVEPTWTVWIRSREMSLLVWTINEALDL